MIKAIIFDLDGTLLYTLKDLKISLNYALKQNNYPPISLKKTKQLVGNGVKNLVKKALNSNDDKLIENTFQCFKKHYDIHQNDHCRPYFKIKKLLKEIKKMQLKIVVISNKYQSGVENLCKIHFESLIDLCIGSSDKFKLKPSNETTIFALNKLNIKADEALFVGDSEVDILTSQNANISCVSVSWGYRDYQTLRKMNSCIIKKPMQLIKIIKESNKNE